MKMNAASMLSAAFVPVIVVVAEDVTVALFRRRRHRPELYSLLCENKGIYKIHNDDDHCYIALFSALEQTHGAKPVG